MEPRLRQWQHRSQWTCNRLQVSAHARSPCRQGVRLTFDSIVTIKRRGPFFAIRGYRVYIWGLPPLKAHAAKETGPRAGAWQELNRSTHRSCEACSLLQHSYLARSCGTPSSAHQCCRAVALAQSHKSYSPNTCAACVPGRYPVSYPVTQQSVATTQHMDAECIHLSFHVTPVVPFQRGSA